MLDRLVPHVRGAFDVAARLKGTESRTNAFERALDWLTDGAALLRKDGRVLYSNAAFDVIVRNNDGVRIAKGAIEFAAPQARARFAAALTTTCRVGGGDPDALRLSDFLAPRARDAPAYIVSLRPLLDEKEGRQRHHSVAIVFVRDPLGRNAAAARMLRELFGFTEAEANLAQALQAGVPLDDYARDNSVTLNTVYTHLRHIKEKTGCARIAKLHRKLKELEVPLVQIECGTYHRIIAPITIIAPPINTTASRIAVCTRTGSRSTNALARKAPAKPTPPISKPKATTCGVTTPA